VRLLQEFRGIENRDPSDWTEHITFTLAVDNGVQVAMIPRWRGITESFRFRMTLREISEELPQAGFVVLVGPAQGGEKLRIWYGEGHQGAEKHKVTT